MLPCQDADTCAGLVSGPDGLNVFGRELAPLMGFAQDRIETTTAGRCGPTNILQGRHPFQVGESVVGTVAVEVVAHKSIRTAANEGFQHESMYQTVALPPARKSERDLLVAIPCNRARQKSLPTSVEHAALVGNLVQSMKAVNVRPTFILNHSAEFLRSSSLMNTPWN